MADTFEKDLQRAKGINTDLQKILEDRQKIAAEGKSTGRFVHKIKAIDNELKTEITALEKLVYFYQNDDKKYENISSSNKNKRIKQTNEFLKKAKDQRN